MKPQIIVLFHSKCIKKYDSRPQVVVLFVVPRYDRKVQRYDTKVRRQLAAGLSFFSDYSSVLAVSFKKYFFNGEIFLTHYRVAHKKPHFRDFYLFLILSITFDSDHRFPWSWYHWIALIMDYPTTPRSWKTMVGIKSYAQNKEEVKISKLRFFMRHPVYLLGRSKIEFFTFPFHLFLKKHKKLPIFTFQ